ncbi:MAG: hypothetical protein V3V99_03550 [candidate division Zixibacteria bacterium]
MRTYFYIISGILILLIAACGDDDSPTGSRAPGWTFNEFVIVDTNEYIMLRAGHYMNRSSEQMVNWEQSFGEPFFDINGNGRYDWAIDSFIIDWDSPLNHDLNHDNLYTSDDPDKWTPGVPFDDLDGNGVLRRAADSNSYDYADGVPFSDYNGDGEYFDGGNRAYLLTRFDLQYGEDGNLWFGLISDSSDPKIANAKFRYISDSGIVYELPVRINYQNENFCITDSNLIHYAGMYIMPVLDKGTISPYDSNNFVIRNLLGDEVIGLKVVTVDTTIEIEDQTYSELVTVLFSFERESNFYAFSREYGLLYYRHSRPGMGGYSLSFHHRIPNADSLIFPMTRIEP